MITITTNCTIITTIPFTTNATIITTLISNTIAITLIAISQPNWFLIQDYGVISELDLF